MNQQNFTRSILVLSFLIVSQFATQAQSLPSSPILSGQVKQFNQHGFIENKGQVTDQFGNKRTDVLYVLVIDQFKLVLRSNGFSYELSTFMSNNSNGKEDGTFTTADYADDDFDSPPELITSSRIDVNFLQSNKNIEVEGLDKENTYLNYYTSNQPVVNVGLFDKIAYRAVYPGIDLIFYFEDKGDGKATVKYEWNVSKGGNSRKIALAYNGASSLVSETDGSLFLGEAVGFVQEQKPVVLLNGIESPRAIAYEVKGNIVQYKMDRSLIGEAYVIDPTISWAMYYGGTGSDKADEVRVDDNGNVFVCGRTGSNSNIATSGTYQTTKGGGTDAFLSKFSGGSCSQTWGTYYGGSEDDIAYALAIDPTSQDVVIAGKTKSSSAIAANCTTSATLDCNYTGGVNGSADGFVAKFNNSNGTIIRGVYAGGPGEDYFLGVACDASGNVYASGHTRSDETDSDGGGNSDEAPIKATYGYQSTYGGNGDDLVIKWNSDLSSELYGTYMGVDNDEERGHAIYVGTDGAIIQIGTTDNPSGTPLATTGAYQTTYGGGNADAFIVKWSSTLGRTWCTYYGGGSGNGGTGVERGRDVRTDDLGFVYATGHTTTDCASAPCTAIATSGTIKTKPTSSGEENGFAVKLSSDGTTRIWGTYVGGDGDEETRSLRVSPLGSPVYVSGWTKSTTGLATADACDGSKGGTTDYFFVEMNWNATQLQYATYFGGTGEEAESGDGAYYDGTLDIDASGNIYVAGETKSSDLADACTTACGTYGGNSNWDAFVGKFTYDCSLDDDAFEPNNTIASPVPQIGFPFSNSTSIKAKIDVSGDVDGYKIVNADNKLTLHILLTDLPANYSLYLYNSTPSIVASSLHSGTTDEEITYNSMACGATYYVVVIGVGTAHSDNCYTLNLDQSGACSSPKEETISSLSFDVYPNPSDGSPELRLESNSNGSCRISILDLSGRIIKQFTSDVTEGSNILQLSNQNLKRGAYTMVIEKDGSKQLKQFEIF